MGLVGNVVGRPRNACGGSGGPARSQSRGAAPTFPRWMSYTALRCSEATASQILCTVPHSGPRARYSYPHRADDAQASAADTRPYSPSRSRSALVGSSPSWVADLPRIPGDLMFISIGIVFASATPVATGILFIVQIFEDFGTA